ncbi:MAG: hypothetical protein R3E32_14590 [Chitinophagales bacterium]
MPIIYDIKQDELYKQGIEEGIKKVAIRCIEQNMGHEEVAIITGLTINQVKEIDNKRKNHK